MDIFSYIPDLTMATLVMLSVIVAALLLIFFLIIYRDEKNLADSRKINLEGKSSKWIEKKVQELVRVEAYRLAGDLKAHLQKWPEAAELYKKGGNLKKAAESYLAAGDQDQAAEAYAGNQDFQRAAELYVAGGDFRGAAEAHLRAGDPVQAAHVFERGGLFDKAAEIYLEQGLLRKAAATYSRTQSWSRAGDALWRAYGQEKTRLPEEVAPGDSMPLRLLAVEAGDFFKKAGRVNEAVNAYRSGGWLRKSAEILEETGDFQSAAQAYMEAGEEMKAAACFERAGQDRQGAQIRANHHLERGREREALVYLETAGEYGRAAEIHRKFEAYIPAGENYEKAGAHGEAAAMFERAGEYERAAAAHEKAGDFKSAASLYNRAGNFSAEAGALEKAGEFLAAGENFYERGLLDRAIASLQKVPENVEGRLEASLLLGQVFQEKGMPDLAYEYFRRAVDDGEVSRDNLERYYHLSVCAERMGKLDEAASIFEKILVLDFHFKDVAGRLNAIKAGRTVVETPSHPDQAATLSRAEAAVGDVPLSRDSRYQLLTEIGRGGMGIVYRAEDRILERTVAFKVLPTNLKDHPQALKNFFREAKSAARLNHPNIVTVYDAGDESGTYYIAMEYVEGETIKQILNREGPLASRALLMISGQICRALEYAHDKRIVHRDIKSSNIMWTPDKQVKLMDFGLAKVIEEVKGYQTIASGTPYYMSPEQIQGRNIDHRTDIYSLGVTMFEMTTGKLPFMHGDATYHHVHTPPPEACKVNESCSPQLSDIILRCMQKKPDQRFQTAHELFDALRKVVTG